MLARGGDGVDDAVGEATGDAEKDAIVEEDRGGAERVGGGGAAVVERAADQHGRGGERAVA